MNYQLQNRYQDGGWENLDGEDFRFLNDAKRRAQELSKNSIAYGMVRVVNIITETVDIEYPAGGAVMSHFEEWIEDYFSKEDVGKIYSIGCWSYGSSRKKSVEEIRSQLNELGVEEDVITEFIDGVGVIPGGTSEKMDKLASVQHDIWCHWMRYMFHQGTFNEDGTWTMPKEKVDRWQRQASTDYANLTEIEKDSNREQIAKFTGLMLGEYLQAVDRRSL